MEGVSNSAQLAFPRYEHPPIVERVVTVTAPMSEETYVSRIEAWRKIVEPEFPIYEPVGEWKVAFEQKGTQAVVDPTRGELVIIPRFSKRAAAEGFDWSVRCPRGRLIVNMHADPQA